MRLSSAVAVFVGSALVGCSSHHSSPPVCQGAANQESCLTDHYLSGGTAIGLDRCDGNTELKISGKRELSFHYGSSPTTMDDAVVVEGRSLQAYFKPYDLQFFTKEAATSVSFQYALEGDLDDVQKKADAAGVDLTKRDADGMRAARSFIGGILAKNLHDFVISKSDPVQDKVHIVVISSVMSPAIAKEVKLQGTIVGMGLSPQLLKDTSADSNSDLFALFNLPDDFTPTLFIGYDDIQKLGASSATSEIIVAHELGHSFGLKHVPDDHNNLMYPSTTAHPPCLPGLSDDQVHALDDVSLLATDRRALQRTDGVLAVRDVVDAFIDAARARAAQQ